MASYSAKQILEALENKGKQNAANGPKLTYWKPMLGQNGAPGEYEIRFLPYASADGKHCPFQEVSYYEKLGERRLVAPMSFDLPDPVKDVFEEQRKTKTGWAIAKNLQPRPRFYAVIIVRGEEDKGPQVWEFAKEFRDQIFGILTHKDNLDEDMFSPETGYDFTLKVAQAVDPQGKPRSFNGNAVKTLTLTPRKKPSKLAPKAADAEKWLAAMPKLDEFFRKQVKQPEELHEAMEALVASLAGGGQPAAPRSTGGEGTNHTATRTPGDGVKVPTAAERKLQNAFALDGDE